MFTRIDLRDQDLSARELAETLPRARLDTAAALEAVIPTIEDVRVRGAAAVRAPRPAQAPPGAVYRLVRSSSMTPAQLRP